MYAAAAVGVSHLVQSTRAGATFGYSLIWAILLANIIKYPFFKVGSLYPSITGKSLLDGYQEIGNYALVITTIINFLTLFFVQAAITIVTAGLLQSILGIEINILILSTLLLLSCTIILIFGKYSLLDNLIKIIMIVLFAATLASVLISSKNSPHFITLNHFDFSSKSNLFFLIALMGWMPAPMDVPIWQSLWNIEKDKSQARTINESNLDFNIGYIGTIILAVCFLLLGAWVMHGSKESFSPSAAVFASQLLALYTETLGSWSYPIIAIACFATMFSTCFACLDAFSRMSEKSIFLLSKSKSVFFKRNSFLIIISSGALLILLFFLKDMKTLVDFVTTISFLIAPIYCFFNFKLMNLKSIPNQHRPSKNSNLLSILLIAIMFAFSFYFIYLRFFD